MSEHQTNQHASMSELSDQVAQWNDKLKTFFQDDWGKLRHLIMELEESTWDVAEPTEASNIAVTQERYYPAPEDFVDSPEQQDTVKADRLSDLDAAIEQRIRLASGDRE